MIWRERPELRAPVMVCAFKGWNDAGEAASAALSYISGSFDAARGRRAIDPEEFYDFTAVRPTVQLDRGRRARDRVAGEHRSRSRRCRAPRATSCCSRASSRRCAGGASPTTWSRAAHELGVRMVITLGALLADVPHSRPVAITGITSDDALVERLGFEPPSYEGPTGIVGVLQQRLRGGGPPVGEPVGVGAALRGRRAQPEGRARAGARVRGHRRPGGGRRASWRRPPRTTSARSPPRWRATRRSRPSWSGSRRSWTRTTRRTRRTRASSPLPTRSPAISSASCASAGPEGLDKGRSLRAPAGGHHDAMTIGGFDIPDRGWRDPEVRG